MPTPSTFAAACEAAHALDTLARMASSRATYLRDASIDIDAESNALVVTPPLDERIVVVVADLDAMLALLRDASDALDPGSS